MARVGWVAAETAPDVWKRLNVFSDGWIEVSGFARGLSDTRAQLRRLLLGLVLLGGLVGLSAVLEAVGGGHPILESITALLSVVALVGLVVMVFRFRTRNRAQTRGDWEQARAERDSGQQLRRASGAPLFTRADSARQLADWVEGEVHVEGTDVIEVSATEEGDTHVVTVRLSSGETRTYRSPDAKLPRLLLAFSRSGRASTAAPNR